MLPIDYSSLYSPAFLLGATLVGVIGWMYTQVQGFKKIAEQNETILELLKEQKKENSTLRIEDSKAESESEDDEELDLDYRLPYFTESESEDEPKRSSTLSMPRGTATTSSGYDTEPEIDLDWELYKVQRAPLGPVEADQVYLIITCRYTQFYVKAIVDEEHTAVRIVTFQRFEEGKWDWVETTCQECIQKTRRALADGNCPVPFAMDLAEEEVDEEEDEVIEKPIPELWSLDEFDFSNLEYDYDYETVLYDESDEPVKSLHLTE